MAKVGGAYPYEFLNHTILPVQLAFIHSKLQTSVVAILCRFMT